MTDEKLEYLKSIYDEENDRQKVVEGKCAQIISNSGIFLSLIGLLITLLYNARESISPTFKIILLIFITAIILLYIISMVCALRGLDPLRYLYSRANPNTVNEFIEVKLFKEQVVKDYLTSIDINQELNSTKLEFLVKARNSFVAGIYVTGILTFIMIAYLSFFYIKNDSTIQKVEIVSQSDTSKISPCSEKFSKRVSDSVKRINVTNKTDSLSKSHNMKSNIHR